MDTKDKKFKIAAGVVGALSAGYLLYKLTSGGNNGPYKNQLTDADYAKLIPIQRAYAQERSKVVSDVSYQLVLSFLKGGENFEGWVKVRFNLSEKFDKLALDFKGETVLSYIINGEEISTKVFKGQQLLIPVEHQKEGENEITVRYSTKYSRDGLGLHYYQDPEDNEEYMYTQFEAPFAHNVIPCFDQPDLKATLEFFSFSPKEWQVISNDPEVSQTDSQMTYHGVLNNIGCPTDIVDKFEEGPVFRSFEQTARISTYLYAFVVGPFEHVSYEGEDKANYPPLRVFARKSFIKYVDPDMFFTLTKSGMDYYAEFFGVKYPFRKYDQLFVPEFNSGAMENVGCVTYNETYIPRGETFPQVDKEDLGITITHELAHMWFGNLVTMTWWDDLWLNESFATFMSHMCLENAKGLEDYTLSWELFKGCKDWGMRTDMFSTTHPIAADCEDTETAENIFDGISYGKGSSFLKQLVYYIGEEAFTSGMKDYFQKHAWQNTQLQDLIDALQRGCDATNVEVNLNEWSETWVKKSGLNVLTPTFTTSNGKIDSFEIKQENYKYGDKQLRKQRLQVMAFDDDMKELWTEPIYIDSTDVTKCDSLVGKPAPAAVYINWNDWGYGVFEIDEDSMACFAKGLSKIENNLGRKLIYQTAFMQTRDAKASPNKFLELVRSHVHQESSQDVLSELLSRNLPVIINNYIPAEYATRENELMFDMLKTKMFDTEDEGRKQLVLNAMIGFAKSEAHKQVILGWLENEDVKLTPEQKYSSLISIFQSREIPLAKKKEMEEKWLKDDNSDLAKNCRLSIQASLPEKKAKEEWYNKLLDKKSKLSRYEIIAIARCLFPKNQLDLAEPYFTRFFKDMPAFYRTFTRQTTEYGFYFLSPCKFANNDLLALAKESLEKYRESDDLKILQQDMREDIERMELYIDGQALYEAPNDAKI